jgi:hypothetical protein
MQKTMLWVLAGMLMTVGCGRKGPTNIGVIIDSEGKHHFNGDCLLAVETFRTPTGALRLKTHSVGCASWQDQDLETGWFVFAETPRRLWVCYGRDAFNIELFEDDYSDCQGVLQSHYIFEIPQPVLARLPDNMKAEVRAHARSLGEVPPGTGTSLTVTGPEGATGFIIIQHVDKTLTRRLKLDATENVLPGTYDVNRVSLDFTKGDTKARLCGTSGRIAVSEGANTVEIGKNLKLVMTVDKDTDKSDAYRISHMRLRGAAGEEYRPYTSRSILTSHVTSGGNEKRLTKIVFT